MDLATRLVQLDELVREAKSMPLSSSVLVNRDEVLQMIAEIQESLPEEIKQARWIVRDREERFRQLANSIPQLAWMARLKDRIKTLLANEEPMVIAGDFNVIPAPEDVKSIRRELGRRAHFSVYTASHADQVRVLAFDDEIPLAH